MSVSDQNSFSAAEVESAVHGKLFSEDSPRLPGAPIKMLDRIIDIRDVEGEYDKGYALAEFDVSEDSWFFSTHFLGDPVMPGCLGVDALWQLLGFYLGWAGHVGKGRAFGAGEIKFKSQVLPEAKLLRFRIDIRKVKTSPMVLGLANGFLEIDGVLGTTVKDIKVGLFPSA